MYKQKRKPLIAGNWKMNMTRVQTQELLTALVPLVEGASCDIVVCPPFLNLSLAVALTRGTNIAVGAQNVHWTDSGAYTGEISAVMLRERGVQYAIIGHSERRKYFGETDETVNLRAKAALRATLTPILCVGETAEEREECRTGEVVGRQVSAALAGIEPHHMKEIIVAYEPIWAIGTGVTPTAEQANDTCSLIRRIVADHTDAATADDLRILYGGSMNAKNAESLLEQPEIDGGLIGGASLKAADFSLIVKSAQEVEQ